MNKIYLIFSLVFLFILNDAAFSDTKIDDMEYRALTESFLGYEEDNNIYRFEKAVESYHRLIKHVKSKTDEKKKDKLIKKYQKLIQINESRVKSFKTKLRNTYPYIHFIQNFWEFRDTHKSSDKIAIENVIDELSTITSQSHSKHGQVGILLFQENHFPMEILSHAMTLVQKKLPFGPYLHDEHYSFLGKLVSLKDIKQNPEILKPLLHTEGLEHVVIFTLNREKGIDHISHYTGQSLVYSLKQPDTLKAIAISDGFGENTYDIETSAEKKLAITIISLILLCLLLYLFMIKLIERGSILENLKPAAILVALLLLGIGAGPALEILISKIFTDLQGPLGAQSIYLISTITVFIVAATGVLIILLLQFEGYFVLSKNKIYLPSLMLMFFSGFGVWFVYRLSIFLKVYPFPSCSSQLWYILPSFLISGFFTGISIQRFMNRNHITKGKIINGFLFLLIGIGTLSYNLERLNRIDFSYLLTITVVSLVFFIILEPLAALIGKNKKGNDSEQLSLTTSIFPGTVNELKQAVEYPLFCDPIIENQPLLQTGNSLLNQCLDTDKKIEGGVLYITGKPGAGKSRYIDELLQLNDFKKSKIIRLRCEKNSNGETKPFAPFISGLQEIQDIRSLEEAYHMNSIIRDSSGMLHEPASGIPVIGPLISYILKTDTSKFTDKSDESAIIHRIALKLTRLSRDLIRKAAKSKTHSSRLIFVVDNFQDIDEPSRNLLSKIQNYLMDDKISPEDNPVAFILIETINTPGRIELPEMENVLHLDLPGLNKKSARNLFINSLNFSPSGKALLEIIFNRYDFNSGYILPGYFLKSIKAMADYRYLREDSSRGFILKSDISPELLPMPALVRNHWQNKLISMSRKEQEILELASVAGTDFSINTLISCLEIDQGEILRHLNTIEEKTGYIIDYDREGDLFRFASQAARDVIIEKLNYSQDARYNAKQLLEFYHTLLYTKYFQSIASPDINEKVKAAYHASRGETSLRIEAIDLNRELINDFFISNSNYNQAAVHLSLLLDLTKKDDWKDYDFKIARETAWIIQNGREIIFNDFPVILEYCNDLRHRYEDPGACSAFLANTLAELAFILGGIEVTRETWDLNILQKYANHAFNISETSKKDKSWAAFWLANSEKISGNNGKCREYLDIAEKYLNQSSDTDIILKSRIMTASAEAYHMAEDYKRAKQLFTDALVVKKEIKDDQGAAMILAYLTSIELKNGSVDHAGEYAEECLALNQKMDNDFGISIALKNLALISEKLNDSKKARAFLLERLNYLENDTDRLESIFSAAKIDMAQDGNPGNDIKRHLQIYLELDEKKKKQLDRYIKGLENKPDYSVLVKQIMNMTG